MAMQAITQGAISAFFNDPNNASSRFPVPVLQCLQIKTLDSKGPGANTTERYRIVLSDLQNYVQCMLATQANHVVRDGDLERGCLIRLKAYQPQPLKGKNILIVLELEVIKEYGTPEKLGDPKPLEVKVESAPAQHTAIGGNNFYGNNNKNLPVKQELGNQESKSQLHKQLPSRTGSGGDHATSQIYPIESLSPYAHKWTIKARVTVKSDVKTWHKASGEGKLFSVNLLDESGEIKATGFNEQCDQFYDLFQEGTVYHISSPCRVQLAKKQFSNLPNDYELTFERDTKIEKAEDQGSAPKIRFNFCNIEQLQNTEKDATVDIIGVLKEVGEVSSIESKKTGKPYEKRELTLCDQTGYSVRATLWGKLAVSFDAPVESVLALKGLRVSDFGGRSLSLLSSGTLAVDPDIEEAHKLKGWYDSHGHNSEFSTHSNMANMSAATGRKDETKNIQQVKDEQLGMEDQAYFTLKATIVYIRQENFAYPSCRSEGCKKKVTDTGDGWRCESCNVTHERPLYRYIMSVNVNDHTNQLWLSCFDEVGSIIMGRSADELMEIKLQESDARLSVAFEPANCRKFNFRCRAKMDTYGDNQRVRYQVMSVSPIDYKSEGLKLAELIKKLSL